MKDNAATITTNLGGGDNGYLGLVVTATTYATIAPTAPFTIPVFPGQTPVIPAGASTALIGETVRQHTANLQQYHSYNNVHAALKKQLIQAVDPSYLRAIRHRHGGFANKSLREMLHHLFDNYGHLTPMDMMENSKVLTQPWNPAEPIATLFDRLEDAQELADTGGAPISATILVNAAYTLVFNTGLFYDDCKDWTPRPIAEKTWVNFKSDFQAAQLRQQQMTTSNPPMAANITDELWSRFLQQTMDVAPTPTIVTDSTNSDSALSATTDLAEKLAIALAKIKKLETANGKQPRGPRAPPKSYCWTHGYTINENHSSQTCNNPKHGHKKEATMTNNMGGNQYGKPTNNE